MPSNVLLTGSTGCVGSAVRECATGRKDVSLWCAARRAPPGEGRATGWLESDLIDLPERLPHGIDACIHTAAVVHRGDASEDDFQEVNYHQTLRLAEALSDKTEFNRFVFVSTVAAGADIDQLTPYGRWKGAAESGLAELGRDRGFQAVSIRLGTVYGRKDRGNIGQLYRAISSRRYVRVAPARTLKSLVSAHRAGAALLSAATTPKEVPPLSVLVNTPPTPLGDIEEALAAVAGVPPPPRAPCTIGLVVAVVGSIAGSVGFRAPLDLTRLRTLKRPAVYEPYGWDLKNSSVDAAGLTAAFQDAYGRRSLGDCSRHSCPATGAGGLFL